MQLQTKLLSFAIDENGANAGFILQGKEEAAVRTSDYFRLILDDGLRTEIPIMSAKQKGQAVMQGEKLIITYDNLVSEYGDTYDVKFTVTVEVEDGLLKFTPELENNTKNVRINECFCPLADFNELYGEKSEDIIYFPEGLGTRVENPWKFMQDKTSVWYQHDEYEIFWHYHNYPVYQEPYPGAFEELKANIKKVQDMGGRIILECNCHFLDPNNPYYKEFGDEVKIIDINGNEIRPAFVYPGRGEFRATYGAHQFPICCTGTERWRNQVLSQLQQMSELGADCVFADCFCGCPYQPCFNDKHEHGPRVDEEWIGHRKFFEAAVEYCDSVDKVFAGEVVTDVAAPYTQFIHGLVNVDFTIKSNQFPQMFRYTFPEVITTERGIRDSEGDSPKRMRAALTAGVRLDCELYVCRADIGRDAGYAAMVDEYTTALNKYAEFYYYGKYTVIDVSKLPYYIKRGEFYNADGTKVLRVLYNAADESAEACGVALGADEIRFDIFDAEEYCR